MRDPLKYPITLDEQIEAVEWALDQAVEDMGERIGDIRPWALETLLEQMREQRDDDG